MPKCMDCNGAGKITWKEVQYFTVIKTRLASGKSVIIPFAREEKDVQFPCDTCSRRRTIEYC